MRRMKDSGIAWIGEIPEGWDLKQLRRFAQICNGADAKEVTNANGQYPVIGSGGIFGQSSEFIYDKPSVLLGRKGTIDKPVYVDTPFWVVDTMFFTKINTNTYIKFFYYLCTSIPFGLYEYGSAVPSLTQRDLNEIIFPSPTLSEQQRIADYLDAKCAEIDCSMELVRQGMDKLKAYKMSVITEAVTKGLDPDVPMKDSGVPWIGKIPEGWKCLPLKWIVSNVKTGSTPQGAEDKYYSEDGLKWFTPSDFIQFPYLVKSVKKLSDLGIQKIKVFPQNSVLLVGIGATMGKVALSLSPCSSNQQINAIQCGKGLSPLFLAFYLSTITDYLFKCGKFTTMPILNQEETKNICIPFPPLPEQRHIASYLDTKCAEIDAIIAQKQELLDKLAAYKKSLIFECVTGKREVAA